MRLALILALLPASTAALLPISAGRRAVLRETAAALAVAAAVPPAVAAADGGATQPMESVDVSAYQNIAGGGRYADLLVGKGTEVNAGSKVSLQWVLRRSKGYYVDGSIKLFVEHPLEGVAVFSRPDSPEGAHSAEPASGTLDQLGSQ